MEGIHGTRPAIKKVSWPIGKIQIDLEDGRSIIAPLKLYPTLKKLAPKFRKKILIVGDQVLLFKEGTDTVYHLQDFMGKEVDYRYNR